jgi:ubiquinone biosynthesis protein Coq4
MIQKIKSLRARMLEFLAHDIGLPYFRLVRTQTDFPYTLQMLQAMPADTVGHQLAQFFIKNNLSLLPYYERHDIKHVVLEYPPTEEGEVCLQTFMWANGRRTLPVFLAVAYGWSTMPEYWQSLLLAWKRGKAAKSLNNLDWLALIPLNVDKVRTKILH